jgi:hypothetical protein
MSRPLTADFVPIPPEAFAPGRWIREGDDSPMFGELELGANLHWTLAKVRTPLISTGFWNDSGAGAGVQAYVYGGGSATIQGTWVVPVLPGPWTSWDIRLLASNTDGANAGTARVERSDGTGVNISITAGATEWTGFAGVLAQDVTLDEDVLQLKLTNPAAGEVRVHWIEIRPSVLSSIPATTFTLEGGERWCPIDTLEVDVQSPLSVALRRRQFQAIEAIRQSRIECVVGWSDIALFRTPAYRVSSGSYETVLRVLFRAGPRRRRLRWGLVGFVPSGSASVRLSTATMRAAGTASVVATLSAGAWTAPYSSNIVLYSDTGLAALDTTPNAWDEIFVELTGTNATLMGLTAWLVDA